MTGSGDASNKADTMNKTADFMNASGTREHATQ
jgi:hypothetical protein